MKSIIKIGAVALAVSMAAGCATVTYSSPGALDGIAVKGVDGKVGQAVTIDTSGFYMFWAVPLVSGDLRWNDGKKSIEGGASFFKDQVSIADLQAALLKIAESRNCDLADVNYFDGDVSYAGPSYGGVVGTCFGSSHMSVSAILVPRKAANREGK
jgi:hypothetical protein